MTSLKQIARTIPGVEYCYGMYKLRRYRREYGPEFARIVEGVPFGVPPLSLANSLNQYEWLVRHRLFPAGLLERLMPPGEGQALDRAFANFARGYVAEELLAVEWQRSETVTEAAERRLTEFLNQYVTYALRTFGVHLEMHGNPESSDSIRIARVLRELEGERGDLLDVGCAFVPLAERYARMRRWVGLDLSLPALAIGRIIHDVSPDSLVCGYSEDLPFPHDAFDVVVSSEVLEHTPRPARMVAEIARVLRPGGKAVLSVPMHIVDYQDGRQHLIGPTDSTHRFRFHTLDELQALFNEHGLTTERLQSDPHYMFTLRKTRVAAAAESPVPVQSHPTTGDDSANAPREETMYACPDCRGTLRREDLELHCTACSSRFETSDGVPVLLPRRLRSARLDLVV